MKKDVDNHVLTSDLGADAASSPISSVRHSSFSHHHWQPWLILPLAAGLLVLAWLRPERPLTAPPKVPLAEAQPWMADCLPGIGAKRRDGAAKALAVGELDKLPKQTRRAVGEYFIVPTPSGISPANDH